MVLPGADASVCVDAVARDAAFTPSGCIHDIHRRAKAAGYICVYRYAMVVGIGCVGGMHRLARPREFQILYSADANSREELSLTLEDEEEDTELESMLHSPIPQSRFLKLI